MGAVHEAGAAMNNPTQIPPKMLAQFAERAKRMDGCVKNMETYEFPQGTTVVVIFDLENPCGYFSKNAERAEALRRKLTQQAMKPVQL